MTKTATAYRKMSSPKSHVPKYTLAYLTLTRVKPPTALNPVNVNNATYNTNMCFAVLHSRVPVYDYYR